uniref:DUF4378 domain-containing protein n=1 Tax=Solanum lycopersicum TaxID=4081 RepID=A0A3Q7HZ01_SOLLC
MAQKHLHELLQEDQEPFKLKHYIADRRCQLNKNPSKYSLQTVKKQKSISSPSNTSTLLCKHACFFTSIRKKSDGGSSERLSPINFPASTKSPVRKVFLHIPASTSSLLLESAMRIQKKQKNRPKLKKTQMGFGLFGSILKKFMNKKREIGMKRNEIVAELTSGSCSCNHSRLSSAGWSESNEEKSMDFETSSSCRSENEEIEDIELEMSVVDWLPDAGFFIAGSISGSPQNRGAQQQLLSKLRRFEKLAELDPIELEKLMLEEEEEEGNNDLEYDNDSLLSYRDRDFETFASEVTFPFDMKRLVSDLIYEEKTETNNSNNREEEVVFGRVCKRLDSWQHVRSDTIDMMIESDFKTELDDWKKFHEQREEAALEVEVSIFRLLVEELAEEIVHFGGHHW